MAACTANAGALGHAALLCSIAFIVGMIVAKHQDGNTHNLKSRPINPSVGRSASKAQPTAHCKGGYGGNGCTCLHPRLGSHVRRELCLLGGHGSRGKRRPRPIPRVSSTTRWATCKASSTPLPRSKTKLM